MQVIDAATVAPPQRGARARLLDVAIDRVTLAELMAQIDRACEQRRTLRIATTSVHFLSLARHDDAFRRTLNDCEYSVADGRLLLWVTRLAGEAAPEQITGHDIFRDATMLAARRGWRVFLLGGRRDAMPLLLHTLRARMPGIDVEGTDGGCVGPDGSNDRDVQLLEQIRRFDPHMLFVALGAPKQERWIEAHHARLAPCVAVGVGSVFDTQIGLLPRAPRWMQRAGLESGFQLAVAPARYARRYLLEDPPTLVRMLLDALRQRRGAARR